MSGFWHRSADTGRFTAHQSPPETTLYEEDGLNSWSERSKVTVSETPEFDRRVRRLLGVGDQRARVTTYTEHGESGDSTIESWDCVTVACAGREFTLDGSDALPRMLRRIEHIDQEKPRDTVMRYLGRAEPVATGDVVFHFDTGREIQGHIRYVGAGDVYLEAEGQMRSYQLSDLTHITAAPRPLG